MKDNILKHLGLALFVLLAITACRNEDNKINPTCFDETKNQGELRVDCGGPNCPECPPSCDDRIQNQGEQSPVTATNQNVIGIDCGGDACGAEQPCATCDDGVQNAHWVRNLNLTPEDLQYDTVGQDLAGNLYSLVMETGIDCGFPCPQVCLPTCEDGIQNGDETGVDCGGSCTDPCPPANCLDGIQNGTETGIDCGDSPEPSVCGPCPDPTCTDGIQNIHIEVSDDFVDGYLVVIETGIDCDDNPFTMCPDCPIPTCFDGIQNGAETGIDCGGNCITLCDLTESCNNGIQDGAEEGIDCGGPNCPPCPTCADDIKNGPEFDVDCLDYPIPGFETCEICPSCHDLIQNTPITHPDDNVFELDVDCGGIDCPACEQELVAFLIGSGNGNPFRDQYSYNRILAASGMTDTLGLDQFGIVGFMAEKITDVFSGLSYVKITGNQGIEIQGVGILIRTVTLAVPMPPTDQADVPSDLIELVDQVNPFGCDIIQPIIPYLTYRERIINATTPNIPPDKCFFTEALTAPAGEFNYYYSEPGAVTSPVIYAKGETTNGNLLYTPFGGIGTPEFGVYDDVSFKANIPKY